VILGTAAYMSPEQARGKPVDQRTDIWAFGCVLFEMVTGKAAFAGETVADVIAAIMQRCPHWESLPDATPHSIQRVVRRCLEKDIRNRLQHIGDARLEIAESLAGVDAAFMPTTPKNRHRAVAWLVLFAAVAAGAAALGWTLRPSPRLAELRLDVSTVGMGRAFAVSPLGDALVIGGRGGLHLRRLNAEAIPLRGTEGAGYPFWSPDGRHVAFFSQGKLKRIDLSSGVVQVIADSPGERGGAWTPRGTILFAPDTGTPLMQVRASGGEPTTLTTLGPKQTSHRIPQLLPDGAHFLLYVQGAPDVQGVYLGETATGEIRFLLESDAAATYAAGHLLFVRDGNLLAQRFDERQLQVNGDPFAVARRVEVDTNTNVAALSASPSGVIAYRPGEYRAGGPVGRRQLIWYDRAGRELGRVGEPDDHDPVDLNLSRDGATVVLQRSTDANQDLWLLDVERGQLTRLTSSAAVDNRPVWSPDGQRVAFQTRRDGEEHIYVTTVGRGSEVPLVGRVQQSQSPNDWSADGRFLLYRVTGETTRGDLWVLPLDRKTPASPVVASPFDERDGQFSPDGRWIAYQSDASGRWDVYVQAFPGGGVRTQVSASGGAQPRWSPDGRELFYVSLDSRLMSTPVKAASSGRLEIGAPRVLFSVQIGPVGNQGGNRQQYAVAPDGQRFLMNTVIEPPVAAPLTVILNWRAIP
jgi:Tol biopolymer transport system component